MSYDFRSDAILGRAYEYWESKCGGRPMPRRRDIDPSEITRLLPYLQITEFIDRGARIRYRLVGTAIVATYGIDRTGKYFDEVLSGDRLHYFEHCYRLICSERRPILMLSRYVSQKEIELTCHRVVMPLSEDGSEVNQALTAMSFKFPGELKPDASDWQKSESSVDTTSCEVIR